jgi:hypothetical protein
MVLSFEPGDPDYKVDPAFNRKPLADWKALKPDQSFVDYYSWNLL